MPSPSNTSEAAHVRAASFAPAAGDWLHETQAARVLHVFEKACNLVNEAGDVLSIVQHKLGDGPFAVRLHDGPPIDFTQWVSIGSDITVSSEHIQSGALHIDLSSASLWDPVPDWAWLTAHQDQWHHHLPFVQKTLLDHAPPGSLAFYLNDTQPNHPTLSTLQSGVLTAARPLIATLIAAIQAGDRDQSTNAASRLAGLGGGLTPAGDDFLLGVLYGLWATALSHMTVTGSQLVAAAVPRTTRLSGAWLKAGLKGETGTLWHQFVSNLRSGDSSALARIVRQISGVGHTSGSDALAGFIALLRK